VTNLNGALQIFWYHMKGQSLCYSDTNSGWWAMLPFLWNLHWKWPTPFEKCRLRQISAYNVSTVRDSEKSFNYDEYKIDHGLSNELYMECIRHPKSRKGGSKSDFLFIGIKVNFNRIKSATSFIVWKLPAAKL